MIARAVALGVLVCVAACYRHGACRVRITEADCAPASSDDSCTACIRSKCCTGLVAYVNREPGGAAALGACGDANCTVACTPPGR